MPWTRTDLLRVGHVAIIRQPTWEDIPPETKESQETHSLTPFARISQLGSEQCVSGSARKPPKEQKLFVSTVKEQTSADER